MVVGVMVVGSGGDKQIEWLRSKYAPVDRGTGDTVRSFYNKGDTGSLRFFNWLWL